MKNANQVSELELVSLLDKQLKQMQKLLDQQEQLQLTYAEEPSENKSASDTEKIYKTPTSEKKWWQFW